MRAELHQSGERKRVNELSKTPDSAKKCRILEVHPSGESLSQSSHEEKHKSATYSSSSSSLHVPSASEAQI